MQLQPIIDSMRVLFTSVSSMNLEPVVEGWMGYLNSKGDAFELCKFDKGKEEQHHYEGEVDHVIISAFNNFQPDVVIYSGPAEGRCRPLLETFHTIRKSAKIVNLCCDGGCPNWHPLLETYLKEGCFDLTVNIDGNDQWPGSDKGITSIGPIDASYYSKRYQKTIDVGFAGGAGAGERLLATQRLQKECKLVIPERSEVWGTYQSYADFMLSCKRVVNFARTGSGKAWHMKYRVIESGLSSTCLFEQANPITPKYFTPGIDYLEYQDIDHLVDLVKNADASGYGERLHGTVTSKYSADKFWKLVFDKLASCG